MPASASPPPSPPVRTPGQQPSHPASATNRSRTPQNDRFALYSPRNPDRRWIRAKRPRKSPTGRNGGEEQTGVRRKVRCFHPGAQRGGRRSADSASRGGRHRGRLVDDRWRRRRRSAPHVPAERRVFVLGELRTICFLSRVSVPSGAAGLVQVGCRAALPGEGGATNVWSGTARPSLPATRIARFAASMANRRVPRRCTCPRVRTMLASLRLSELVHRTWCLRPSPQSRPSR